MNYRANHKQIFTLKNHYNNLLDPEYFKMSSVSLYDMRRLDTMTYITKIVQTSDWITHEPWDPPVLMSPMVTQTSSSLSDSLSFEGEKQETTVC